MLLIHIFCNSVKSNCGELDVTSSKQDGMNDSSLSSPKGKKSSPTSNKSKKGKGSEANKGEGAALSESLSLALLKNLSSLLSKFQTEEAALGPLVELTLRIQPQHVSVIVYICLYILLCLLLLLCASHTSNM